MIAALQNSLVDPEFQQENNNLLMFPQATFDAAVNLCRKTVSRPGLKSASKSVGTAAYFGSGSHINQTSAAITPSTVAQIAEATAVAVTKALAPLLKGSDVKPSRKPNTYHCDYCGKDGHTADRCYKKERDQLSKTPEVPSFLDKTKTTRRRRRVRGGIGRALGRGRGGGRRRPLRWTSRRCSWTSWRTCPRRSPRSPWTCRAPGSSWRAPSCSSG